MIIRRTDEFVATSEEAISYIKQLKEKYEVVAYDVTCGSYLETHQVTYEVNVDKIINITWKERDINEKTNKTKSI